MARKSKYEPSSAKLSTTLWKPALYIRLSREDGDREESNSIASQRELLTQPCGNPHSIFVSHVRTATAKKATASPASANC